MAPLKNTTLCLSRAKFTRVLVVTASLEQHKTERSIYWICVTPQTKSRNLFQCDLHLTPSGAPSGRTVAGTCAAIEGGYSSIFDYKSDNPQSYYNAQHRNYIPYDVCQRYGAHSVFYTKTDDDADTYTFDSACCGGKARVRPCPSWLG